MKALAENKETVLSELRMANQVRYYATLKFRAQQSSHTPISSCCSTPYCFIIENETR